MKLNEKIVEFVDEAIETADYCTEKNMNFKQASGWVYSALNLVENFATDIVFANRNDILNKAIAVFNKAVVKYPKIKNSYEYTMQIINDVLSCN